MWIKKWWMWVGIFRWKNNMALQALKFGLAFLLFAFSLPAGAQELPCRLSLATIPDKATVTCDGILREETPTTINGLRPGLHLIEIEKAGFLPAKRTLTLRAGQRSSVEIPLERLTGLILVRSIPDGADLEINGAHRGKAPLMITDLPPGRYRIKASSAGYLSRDVEMEVVDRVPKAVLVSLVSDSAMLTIGSTPPGAAVTINGLSKGVTPCKLDRLPAGENEVMVSLPEYGVYRARIKLQANEEQTLDIPLKALPSVLTVISTPAGARLFVDDTLRGQTPLTLDSLEAGSHVLRAELDGYETQTRPVELNKAEKKVEGFELVRNVGVVSIMARPNGVSVLVDGVEKGTIVPASNESVGKLDVELPVGAHVVSLRYKGYGTVEKRVTILKGETVTLKEILKRFFVADTRITLTTGEVLTGVLSEKLPSGDVKLETQLGIYKTLESFRINTIEPLKPEAAK
jgi:hypothetical protein